MFLHLEFSSFRNFFLVKRIEKLFKWSILEFFFFFEVLYTYFKKYVIHQVIEIIDL